MRRIAQITEHHCGPAVVEMLLSHIGFDVTQHQVAHAGGAAETIVEYGMRVDQMARAVATLIPDAVFWYKNNSTMADIVALVRDHALPVGVEWQGLFQSDTNESGEDENDEDPGHYSIVTRVDAERSLLTLTDPYPDFVERDRVFTFPEFENRWWDTNELVDARSGATSLQRDQHMLFIITPKSTTFPAALGLSSTFQTI